MSAILILPFHDVAMRANIAYFSHQVSIHHFTRSVGTKCLYARERRDIIVADALLDFIDIITRAKIKVPAGGISQMQGHDLLK
jgi:hypothetical protein